MYNYDKQYYYKAKKNKDNTYQLIYLGDYEYERTVNRDELKDLLSRQQNMTSGWSNCIIINAKLLKDNRIKIVDYNEDKSDTRKQCIEKLNNLIGSYVDYSIFTGSDLEKLYRLIYNNVNEQHKNIRNRLNYVNDALKDLSKKEIENHIVKYKKEMQSIYDEICSEMKRTIEVKFTLGNGAVLPISCAKQNFEAEINKLNELSSLLNRILCNDVFNSKEYKGTFYEKLVNKLILEGYNYDTELFLVKNQSENVYRDIIKEFVKQHLDKLIKFNYKLSTQNINIVNESYTKKIIDKFYDEIQKVIKKYINGNTEILSRADIVNIINNIRDNESNEYKSVKIKWKTKKYETGYYETARRDETEAEFETIDPQKACVMTYSYKEYRYVHTRVADVGKQELIVLKMLHDESKFFTLERKWYGQWELSYDYTNKNDIDFIKDDILEQIENLKIKVNRDKIHMILGFFDMTDTEIDTIYENYSNKVKEASAKKKLY